MAGASRSNWSEPGRVKIGSLVQLGGTGSFGGLSVPPMFQTPNISSVAKLDHSYVKKERFLGIKLPRPSVWAGAERRANDRKASRFYMPAGWGSDLI